MTPLMQSILQNAPDRVALVTPSGEVTFRELARACERAAPKPLLAPTSCLEDIVTLLASLAAGPVALVHPRWSPAEVRAAKALIDAHGPLEHDATVFFTSGTTGQPKGVIHGHRQHAAAAAASAENLGWRDEDRWLLSIPPAHIGGFSILTRCLSAGATVVLPDPGPFDPRGFVEQLARDRVTLVSLVPTMLQRITDLELTAPAHLRAALLGGAAASPALIEAASALGWPVLTTYGMTETCAQATVTPYGERPLPHGGCGLPLASVEIRVREGRVEVRGPTLMRGYLCATQIAQDDWFATHDLGHLDDRGRLHVLGRSDEVIVTGGENVHPNEVEHALRSCPEISEAVVYGVDDPEWGQRVAAVVESSSQIDISTLKGQLDEHIAGFKKPKTVEVVSALPRTAAGKIDRQRAIEAAGLPLNER